MKFLVALIACIALCAGNAIPLVPGDNSHYVKGESRYIWMQDEEGVPQLVDLEEQVDKSLLNSRNGADNQYWLYTRQNPNNAQILVDGNANSVWNSNYDGSRPLKVVVHGWNGSGNSGVNSLTASAFLAVQDVNVIVLDWRTVASLNYVLAVSGVPGVGRFLGDFIEWLINTAGGDWNNVHLIGYSLGAHVVGNAGRQTGGRPARVTGLDPAGPLWIGNPNALNSNSGQYVEAIHTDGGLQGILIPIADADFYPNGGRNPQPGCSSSACSHARAPEFFASSVRTNHFQGRLCENFNQAQDVQCSGSILNMGNGIVTKRGSGIYGLTTGSSWPF
ncbi:pancreatic lipase-related protein 2-like [Galleria mellonella]|uniref:Pancreatic lipase-related protein 2-like n=1 Tax=Galleria mellonella TaxID=7137 RepID=A0A6J1WSK9_GALME|nr:pancreatic lipase-related protein 2-like [Galleria mellonella]